MHERVNGLPALPDSGRSPLNIFTSYIVEISCLIFLHLTSWRLGPGRRGLARSGRSRREIGLPTQGFRVQGLRFGC